MDPITRYGKVLAHGTTSLSVVYTNNSAKVEDFLSDFKIWLEEAEEEERVMGLDLEYTANGKDVAVIQLCFKKHVLIFQWAR